MLKRVKPIKSANKPVPIPVPKQSQQHSMSDSLKQGFSFGLGSSIANNMIHSIFHKTEKVEPNLDKMYDLYNKCLEKNDKHIDCNFILQKDTYN